MMMMICREKRFYFRGVLSAFTLISGIVRLCGGGGGGGGGGVSYILVLVIPAGRVPTSN